MSIIIVINIVPYYNTTFADEADRRSTILFLSLGMPDDTLRQYIDDAGRYNVQVVIRGFYPKKRKFITDEDIGTLEDTAKRIQKILSEIGDTESNKGHGVNIDPILFKKYQVNAVPALVVDENLNIDSSQTSSEQVANKEQYDIVFGNLPLNKLLEIVAEKSESIRRVHIARRTIQQVKDHHD